MATMAIKAKPGYSSVLGGLKMLSEIVERGLTISLDR